jgi:hypothetical protein
MLASIKMLLVGVAADARKQVRAVWLSLVVPQSQRAKDVCSPAHDRARLASALGALNSTNFRLARTSALSRVSEHAAPHSGAREATATVVHRVSKARSADGALQRASRGNRHTRIDFEAVAT